MNNKPTLLEKYWKIRLDLHDDRAKAMPNPAQLWHFQELLYRISVLEVFKEFAAAAPLSDDAKVIMAHYRAVNAFVENIKKERDFPAASNADLQKQRETAHAGLCSVIEDYRKRYASYAPQGPEQYPKEISRTIGTVLPAWIQYRNTIKEISIEEEQPA